MISWVPAQHQQFGWPMDGHEAEVIRTMQPGDLIVPKFAQAPVWGGESGQEDYVRGICGVWSDDFDALRADYEAKVAWGKGAVPFAMRVKRHLDDDERFPSADPWAVVEVELEWLEHPISTSEFLKLRAVPVELAGQFKAMAAPNRHIQPLPDGAGVEVLQAGSVAQRGPQFLRQESLVRADTAESAATLLADAGREPIVGDRAFLVGEDAMAGLHVCESAGSLAARGEAIAVAPADLRPLLEDARAKATKSDYFTPARALNAADELQDFLANEQTVREVHEFAHFHDRYVILPRKVTEALEIRKRPMPVPAGPDAHAPAPEPDEDGDDPEQIDIEKLHGLTVEAVEAMLPDGMVLPRSVLAEAVTALRSGKHLLLSGPPGTGKSTVAGALCRAVVESRYRVTTATADWTTFDTVGGYLPQEGGGLLFEPGLVLRSFETGSWLVIDELNRADIDKAFGPLFTLLASTGADGKETVLLPYRQAGKNVEIGWAPTVSQAKTRYAITPAWRLLGTMNVSDKASLFQLSFAFLRRFAVIDVPLPPAEAYRVLFAGRATELPDRERESIVDAAMAIAHGPVPLGPAILLDIAAFTERGLTTTSSGSAPYDDPVEAFLTAVRLYAVPQYEGAPPADVETFTGLLQNVWPAPPETAWAALQTALSTVALA
jgi:energy-coupling factor transporter ATP-binding protein EcfA2